MEIPGKVAIITGASAGIGLATARLFADEGARVVLVARSADKLAAVAADLVRRAHEALPLPADMRDPASVHGMVELAFGRFGRIDILVNNAGQAVAGAVANMSPTDFRKVIDLNVFGMLYALQAVVPKMRHGGGGLIINVSSMVSRLHIPGLGGYAASKAALNMLSDTARGELAAENIRVITMYPRVTTTDFAKNSLGDQEMRHNQRKGAPDGDSPEQVASRILEAVLREPAEQFME